MTQGENGGENNSESAESDSIFSSIKKQAADGTTSYFNSQFESCPSCEKGAAFNLKRSLPTYIIACKNCGARLKQTVDQNWKLIEGDSDLVGESHSIEYWKTVDVNSTSSPEPQGDYVSTNKIEKVADLLDSGEKVHYMARGKMGVQGTPRLVVTDKRVLVKVPEWLGDDQRSIPYESIKGIDLESGIINQEITLHMPGGTIPLSIRRPGKKECRELVEFVRKKTEEQIQSGSSEQTSQKLDPTERLKNLKELYDDGVLSEEEFESKKEDIIDEI